MSLPKNKPDSSRRSFLATAAVAASAALVGLKPPSARAAGESLPHAAGWLRRDGKVLHAHCLVGRDGVDDAVELVSSFEVR